MVIRKAQPSDWDDIMEIYARARQFMRETGNPTQWGDFWPPEDLIREDIRLGRNYVCESEGRVQAVFAMIPGDDPSYHEIEGAWLDNGPYCAVHRVASRGEVHGLTGQILEWCLERCGSVRIDTHNDNRPMQRALEKAGFTRCGQIICADDGVARVAFQRVADGRGPEREGQVCR